MKSETAKRKAVMAIRTIIEAAKELSKFEKAYDKAVKQEKRKRGSK